MNYLIYIFTFLFCVASCMDDEEYTVSPHDVLTFSTDTVSFDTIISGEPTHTYRFSVYNQASKAIRITRVELEKGADSPFKVNVDGMPLNGGYAEDFEIASKDSMIVYLMANLPDKDSDVPVDESDKLTFITESGQRQQITLCASGQSVTTLKDFRITQNTIFDSKRPYQIMDSLVVNRGCVLTLASGTRLYFHPDARLIVYGTLHVAGTLDSPVTLRGDRLGNMFDGQPYDRIPGQWGGVVFASTSYNNIIEYADIHSSQFGVRVDSSDISLDKLSIENSIIHNTTNHALDMRMAKVAVGNSQITNAGGDCIRVRGGDVSLIHCTVGRFYIFAGGSGVALNFSNSDGDIRLPLSRFYVANTLITGYQSDEVMGYKSEKYETDAFDYEFVNCLLNTVIPEENDDKMINCLWDRAYNGFTPQVIHEQNFTPEFRTEDLWFSFELSPESQAVGNADMTLTSQFYPYDRLGHLRQPQSDIGCYQHQPTSDMQIRRKFIVK